MKYAKYIIEISRWRWVRNWGCGFKIISCATLTHVPHYPKLRIIPGDATLLPYSLPIPKSPSTLKNPLTSTNTFTILTISFPFPPQLHINSCSYHMTLAQALFPIIAFCSKIIQPYTTFFQLYVTFNQPHAALRYLTMVFMLQITHG